MYTNDFCIIVHLYKKVKPMNFSKNKIQIQHIHLHLTPVIYVIPESCGGPWGRR